MALACAKEIIANREMYDSYKFFEKMFILLPLEHSENVEDGKKMIEMVTEMTENGPNDEVKKSGGMLIKFAKDHFEVIEKFGRYPARNEALGRQSTDEEIEFLKTHKGW